MPSYTPSAWYWFVAGDKTKVWSSAIVAYVPVTNATFEAWASDGTVPSSILSEAELSQVLTYAGVPQLAPIQTIFAPRALIETLFTTAEQQAIFTAAQTAQGWQMAKFIALTTATPQVDITNPEFVADIGQVEAAGLLTPARAAQVLAGTAAPTS